MKGRNGLTRCKGQGSAPWDDSVEISIGIAVAQAGELDSGVEVVSVIGNLDSGCRKWDSLTRHTGQVSAPWDNSVASSTLNAAWVQSRSKSCPCGRSRADLRKPNWSVMLIQNGGTIFCSGTKYYG